MHSPHQSTARPRRGRDQDLSEDTELSRKKYELELRKLHVELVKLQEWVRREGQKVASYSRVATEPAKAASSKR